MFTKDRRGQDERGTSSVPHIPPLFCSSRFCASVGQETKMLELCLPGRLFQDLRSSLLQTIAFKCLG